VAHADGAEETAADPDLAQRDGLDQAEARNALASVGQRSAATRRATSSGEALSHEVDEGLGSRCPIELSHATGQRGNTTQIIRL